MFEFEMLQIRRAPKLEEIRTSSSRADQRKDSEERAEMGQPEGTDILRFFPCHSENERNDESRNNLKREGDRHTDHWLSPITGGQ
jgi:hypothetical protein